MPCAQSWQGQAGRHGLVGLELELLWQPGVSEQDSESPSSSGAFCQPGASGSRVLACADCSGPGGGKNRSDNGREEGDWEKPEAFLLQPLLLAKLHSLGKSMFCSYQIHWLTEHQPCEGMKAFGEP